MKRLKNSKDFVLSCRGTVFSHMPSTGLSARQPYSLNYRRQIKLRCVSAVAQLMTLRLLEYISELSAEAHSRTLRRTKLSALCVGLLLVKHIVPFNTAI